MDTNVKILVIRLCSFGDIILTFPLIRLIHKLFPDAEINFVVKKEFKELIESNTNISNIYIYDKIGGFKELKRIKYSMAAIVFPNVTLLYGTNQPEKLVKTVAHY